MASVCGTGGWSGPQPGDPSTTDVRITATPAFGGIDVRWTYPDLNPNAVAYTQIYRSLQPDAASAVSLVHANGNFYYDRIEQEQTYYYWVVIVSIYGTRSEMIGPAWATSKPLIAEMIEKLTGQIDAGVLAQSLKAEIDQITLNKLGITQEMLDRDANDDALGVRLNEVIATTGETRALLQEEVLVRTSQGEAFVGVVNTMYATLNGNIAAVQQSVTAQITEVNGRVNALANEITNVETSVNGNIAQVQQTLQTNINIIDDTVTEIGALWTVQVNVNGLIGGFGVYNDGRTVEAGFDVDRFWIGRTNANKRKPFIIDNNVVYIDEAAIRYLTFNKLRDEAGTFIVEDGKLKAAYIQADQLEVQWARIQNIDVDTIHIRDAAITTAKIRDLSVQTLKIQDNAVTVPIGASVAAPSLSLNITLDGDYPVFIQSSLTNANESTISFYRNGIRLWFENPIGGSLASRGTLDHPGPGTHTYTLASGNPGNNLNTSMIILVCKK